MSHHRSRFGPLLTGLAALAALAACAGGPDPESTSPSHMYAHYAQVGEIQKAVIDGDLDATRGPARWLSTHEGDEFPPQAREALEMMRAEARIIVAQREMADVARSLGRMANACGECHQATGTGPKLQVQAPPPASSEPSAHMQRHAWAMDRLWEGLLAPSEVAWQAGAGALMGAAVDFGSPGASRQSQAILLAERVHELAGTAHAATGAKQRAEVYGQLLETCALCHERLGMRRR